MARRNKIIKIERQISAISKIFRSEWIDVMDKKPFMNFITGHSEITTKISRDDLLPDALPFIRLVKRLVHPPIKTESVDTDLAL